MIDDKKNIVSLMDHLLKIKEYIIFLGESK